MLDYGGPDKKLNDVELKKFLELQRYDIKMVVNDVLDEKVMPRLDTLEGGQVTLEGGQVTLEREIKETKAESQTAHKEIIQCLERIDQRLEQMDNRLNRLENQ